MESRNVSFFEDVFLCNSREYPSSSKQVLKTINENSQDQDKNGEVKPRRSERAKTKKIFWYGFSDICAQRGTSDFQRGSELYKESHVERGHSK